MSKLTKSTPNFSAGKSHKENPNSSSNVKFIVPMPGGSRHRQSQNFSIKEFHKVSRHTEDLALEDYKANFLMQREYLID